MKANNHNNGDFISVGEATDSKSPLSWNSALLGNILLHRKGKKPKRLEGLKWDGSVPYIDIEAFETGRIRKYADPDSSVIVEEGDVLIVWDGARCGHVGKAPTRGALGSTLMALTSSSLCEGYLLRFLQLLYETINSNPRGTGIPHVDPEVFWNLEMPIAPAEEQKRIVAKIEELLPKVNAVRERLLRVKEIMKRFRQSVLSAACSGRLTEDWRGNHLNVTPARVSINEILDFRQKQWTQENGPAKRYKPPRNPKEDGQADMPESWEIVSSDALFFFVTSGSRGWAKYYSEAGPIFIRVGNLNHDSIALDLSRIQHVDPPRGAERQRTGLRGGDILISITADVGMIGLVPEGIGEAYINQHVAISRPVDGVFRPFLSWYLASREGGQAQFEDLQRGATKVGLGLEDIKSLTVPFPPITEQQQIVRRVESLFKLADEIEKRVEVELSRTEIMTQAILAKTFRGELVPTEAELGDQQELVGG